MDQTNLIALLNRLLKESSETEWLEFKAGYLPAQELDEYLTKKRINLISHDDL